MVPCGCRISLKVVLWAIPLIAIGVLPSSEVVASIVSPVVSLSWCPVPVDIHWDRSVIHPSQSVRGIVLWCALALWVGVVPLGSLLLGDEGSEIFISAEYIPE